MDQKLVSFEVARTIKNAGYPQGNTDKCYLTADHNQFYKEGQIVENDDGEWTVRTKNLADIPTYVDVWFWLWKKKKIILELQCQRTAGWSTPLFQNRFFNDQEEAIINAIDHLVKNDLIKQEYENNQI